MAALRRGRQGDRLLHAQPQARGAAQADAAAVPQPRQRGRLARRAQPLAGREGRGGGRLRAAETVGAKLLVEDGSWSACARATRGATRPAARSRTSSRAPTSSRRRRCSPRAAGATSPARRSRASASPPRTRRSGRSASRRSGRSTQPLDRVIHTLGWPLRPQAKYREFGGSWIYPMNREGEPERVSIGFVVGLDYADARLSVHDVLQEFKLHPLVRRILEGGKRVAWGAKAIPEGGYWAMPRLHAPGMVICGDAGGHGQRAAAQGHPLRDPVRHARGRDALRAPEGRLDRLLRPTRTRSTTRRSAGTSTSRAT